MVSATVEVLEIQEALRDAGWFCFDSIHTRPGGARLYVTIANQGVHRFEASGKSELQAWRAILGKVRQTPSA